MFTTDQHLRTTVRALTFSLLVSLLWGCKSRPSTGLDTLDALEHKASQYGLIVAGAVRVIDYTNSAFREIRSNQMEQIKVLRTNLTMAPSVEQANASAKFLESYANLSLTVGGSTQALTNAEARKDLDVFRSSALSVLTNTLAGTVEAHRPDMMAQRMSETKYLESEHENLRLDEIIPVDHAHFRRFVVSVAFTAWVRPQKATAALVYLDLYPYKADLWCHQVGLVLEKLATCHQFENTNEAESFENEFYNNHLPNYLKTLKSYAFYDDVVLPNRIVFNERPGDPPAIMHALLAANQLLPTLVHVEALDEGELIGNLDLGARLRNLGASIAGGSGPWSAGFAGGSSREEAEILRSQRVNRLSLAFAAGNNRAGWLLLPSVVTESKVMKPIERRISMVVDVPKCLRRMAIHVHKIFLDKSLLPISDVSFEHQMTDLNIARYLISEMDDEKNSPSARAAAIRDLEFKDKVKKINALNTKTDTGWLLIKSRVRNSLHQFWSEPLDVFFPPPGP